MAWRAPYRSNNEITQNFNDGIVTIFAVENVAKPGYQPQMELVPKFVLRYAEQRLGVQRYYDAMQNQIQVERVIRVPRADITNQNIAQTQDGKMYRIDLVQTADGSYPPAVDLTLTKYEQVST